MSDDDDDEENEFEFKLEGIDNLSFEDATRIGKSTRNTMKFLTDYVDSFDEALKESLAAADGDTLHGNPLWLIIEMQNMIASKANKKLHSAIHKVPEGPSAFLEVLPDAANLNLLLQISLTVLAKEIQHDRKLIGHWKNVRKILDEMVSDVRKEVYARGMKNFVRPEKEE